MHFLPIQTQTPLPFILVSGAWHGSWCWRSVIPLLQAAGHRVVAPDLPGLGHDQTPLAEVTFDSGVERIADLARQASAPVVLVGHSAGGMTISQVAENCPDQVARLVYLTALLPCPGESAMDLFAAQQDTVPFEALEITDQQVRLKPEAASPFFYQDCSVEDLALAQRCLRPQPLAPMLTPVTLSDRFESVPRAYIACTADRALPLRLQRFLYTRTPCEPVVALASGHSPFFSMPEHLARVLLSLARMEQDVPI